MKVRRFEHPTKNRFWEVYWDVSEIEVVSGVIGSNGRATRKEFNSPMACAEYLTGELAKRAKEGFEEVVPEIVKNQSAPSATPPPELLQRIVEAPDEDQPRMVYADWLQTQGDPLGELIAVQLELARIEPWVTPPKLLRDREESLLTGFRQRWLPDTVGAQVTFVRGFADSVKLELPFERNLLDRVLELAPLLRTVVFEHPRDSWQSRRPWELASPEALRRITGLHMGGFQIDDAGMEAFAATDLARVDRLAMRSMQMLPSQFKRIAGRAWVELDVHANSLGTNGVRHLTDGDCTKLRVLDLGSNDVMNAGLQLLALTKVPVLETLSLRRSKLASNGMHLLSSIPSLMSLDLSCNDFGGTFDFVLPALTELNLRETNLDDTGFRNLAASSLAPQLVVLDLAQNKITDENVLHQFTALRSLNISGTPLAKSAKALKQALPNVRIVARAKAATAPPTGLWPEA